MCDCITNAFYLRIILVSGYSLDIKELTYAIIINFILYFDSFWAHLLQTLVYIYVHKAPCMGPRRRSAYSLKVLLHIDWGVNVLCSVYYVLVWYVLILINIYTLIKQIFNGSPTFVVHLLNVALSICVAAYIFTLLLLSLYWVLDILGRH